MIDISRKTASIPLQILFTAGLGSLGRVPETLSLPLGND